MVDNYVEQLQMIPVLRVHQIELTKLMVTTCSPKDTEGPVPKVALNRYEPCDRSRPEISTK